MNDEIGKLILEQLKELNSNIKEMTKVLDTPDDSIKNNLEEISNTLKEMDKNLVKIHIAT